MQQRVAILGEDDRRLVDAAQKTGERGDLRLVPRRSFRGARESAEKPALVRGILETEKRRPGRRLVSPSCARRRRIAEGKIDLAAQSASVVDVERREPPVDRMLQRSRARKRSLVQHRQREPVVARASARLVLKPNRPREARQQARACERSSRLIRTCSR